MNAVLRRGGALMLLALLVTPVSAWAAVRRSA